MGEQRGVRRIPLKEAAVVLGVSKDAVRQRIRRGTLRSDKGEDGRVYVHLDASVDDVQGDAPGGAADPALVDELRDRVRYLERQVEEEREARRRADTLLARLMDRMPELEAASETPGSPETVEEESEKAEPRSDLGGTQEATERPPQERNGWRAPVVKLPWWQYVLGLVLVGLASLFLDFILIDSLRLVENGVPAGVFGFWVGIRRRNPRFWSQIIPFGVLVGLVVMLGDVANTPLRELVRIFEAHSWVYWTGFLTGYVAATVLAGWLFYVSGALIGSAWQRRHTLRISGTTPPSPLPGANLASPGSRSGWTPQQQAILGFVGTVIAALISFMGAIFSAIVAGGG